MFFFFQQARLTYNVRSMRMKNGYAWLHQNRIKSFYKIVEGLGLEKGGSALMQSVGVGKLAPNIVLLGYKTDWAHGNCNELQEYFNLLQ